MPLRIVDDKYIAYQEKLDTEQEAHAKILAGPCPCKTSGIPECYGCICSCERPGWHCPDCCTNCEEK